MKSSQLRKEKAAGLLRAAGAVLTNGHFVLTHGKHSSAYVDKDRVTLYPLIASTLAELLVNELLSAKVQIPDMVLSPAYGAISLGFCVAYHLNRFTGREVLFAYAIKTANDRFTLDRGFDQEIAGQQVLVVEDILTSGVSALQTVKLARSFGGNVSCVAVLVNRGGVLPGHVETEYLCALLEISIDSYPEEDCPLCKQGITINTTYGKGREFLARKAQKSNL